MKITRVEGGFYISDSKEPTNETERDLRKELIRRKEFYRQIGKYTNKTRDALWKILYREKEDEKYQYLARIVMDLCIAVECANHYNKAATTVTKTVFKPKLKAVLPETVTLASPSEA